MTGFTTGAFGWLRWPSLRAPREERAALRLADGTTRQTFEGPLEIVSLAGTLSRHGLHLHVAVADARAGALLAA